MNSDETPILRISRTVGSWSVALKSMTVEQFLDECRWPTDLSATAVDLLIAGESVKDYDDDMSLTYMTQRPSAVAHQWSALKLAAPSSAAHRGSEP